MPRARPGFLLRVLTICLASTLAILGSAGNISIPDKTTLARDFPQNFRVLYFAADTDAAPLRAKAPALLKESLGADTVKKWRDVLAADQAQKIQALVIDKSALPDVNNADLKRFYRDGVIVAIFDIRANELVRLLDDPCLVQDGFGAEPYISPFFFVSVSHLIQGTPEEIALIRATKPCGGMVEGVTGPTAGVTITKQTDNLLTENDYATFARVLTTQLQTMHNAKAR